jgi:hypothetical protein
MNINANFEAITLTGTMTKSELGDNITGSCVHRVYCLTNGSIDITPMGGGKFTWAGTANNYIDVLVSDITVSTGTFIGFKSKFQPHQFGFSK